MALLSLESITGTVRHTETQTSRLDRFVTSQNTNVDGEELLPSDHQKEDKKKHIAELKKDAFGAIEEGEWVEARRSAAKLWLTNPTEEGVDTITIQCPASEDEMRAIVLAAINGGKFKHARRILTEYLRNEAEHPVDFAPITVAPQESN